MKIRKRWTENVRLFLFSFLFAQRSPTASSWIIDKGAGSAAVPLANEHESVFENLFFAYVEQPCCVHPRHIRHHKNHVREFSCNGRRYYRTFHLNENRNTLYVGAMDHVFKLNLSNIDHSSCNDSIYLEPTDTKSCTSKGKSEDFDCRNHIRVIQSIGDGNRLYICGTNAHNPKDYVIYSNLTHLPRNEHMPILGSGMAKCPYDPLDNSTAIWSEKGNPGELPALYSGTNAEFTKADTVIFRTKLYNLTTGNMEFEFKRTLKYNSHWLDKPDFVGVYDIDQYVFFFFRETAVEYINCGKSIFSRVARVCKKDIGAKNVPFHNWTTYLKARLNCSIPGEYPFYFNEIQSIYKVPGDDTLFYGVFTTSTTGLMGSAICTFRLEDIDHAFAGRFKSQASSTSAWLPVLSTKVPEPRPGQCVNNTESLPDNVLNFIRDHPLMDEAVAHKDNQPVFYVRDLFFMRLVVDVLDYVVYGTKQHYTVYYAATNEGRVYKVVQWYDDGVSGSTLLDIFDIMPGLPITAMEISKKHKALYVASDESVKQINLFMCTNRYNSCLRCVHDPYCGWNKTSNACQPYQPGLLQDVTNSSRSVCERFVVNKKVTVTFGQSVHLSCFVKVPQVLKAYPVTWHHHSKDKGLYTVSFSQVNKYIATVEGGMVIVGASEEVGGQYDCKLAGDLLCTFNLTVDAHRCSPPTQKEDYHRVYSNWCHEFQKYKSAMKSWEKKQAQCSGRSRQNETAVAQSLLSNEINASPGL